MLHKFRFRDIKYTRRIVNLNLRWRSVIDRNRKFKLVLTNVFTSHSVKSITRLTDEALFVGLGHDFLCPRNFSTTYILMLWIIAWDHKMITWIPKIKS